MRPYEAYMLKQANAGAKGALLGAGVGGVLGGVSGALLSDRTNRDGTPRSFAERVLPPALAGAAVTGLAGWAAHNPGMNTAGRLAGIGALMGAGVGGTAAAVTGAKTNKDGTPRTVLQRALPGVVLGGALGAWGGLAAHNPHEQTYGDAAHWWFTSFH
jgi:hypothetical protein